LAVNTEINLENKDIIDENKEKIIKMILKEEKINREIEDLLTQNKIIDLFMTHDE
jgi:hypothetical protein